MTVKSRRQAAQERATAALRRAFVFLTERLTVATIAALVSVWIFSLFSAEINGPSRVVTFDEQVLAFCAAHQYPVLHAVMRSVSWVSNPSLQVVVVGAAVWWFVSRKQLWPQAMSLLLAMFVGQGVVQGLKYLFHRPRPEAIFEVLGPSFPSGHTFTAVAVYGTLTYWVAHALPARRRPLAWALGILAIALVGLSRIYLGEHFPSDVAAGAASGIAWLWFCLSITPLLRRKPVVPPDAS